MLSLYCSGDLLLNDIAPAASGSQLGQRGLSPTHATMNLCVSRLYAHSELPVLPRAHTHGIKRRATQSQQEASQDDGSAALVIKGVKQKRTAATKRELRKRQATEALAWDSPSRPLLTQEGECPPEAYKPADPMDVG